MATSDTQPESPGMNDAINLEKLRNHASLEKLENVVGSGTVILNHLHHTLTDHKSADPSAADWISQIEAVKLTTTPPKTVIGVVGATGAGKSSIINALLDQERILPTNCMRACTSVVTEVSYNYDQEWPYRAVIMFISKEDWREELRIIYNEISDEAGFIKWNERYEDVDSPTAVAYAKIKAVYLHNGTYTRETLQHATIEQLMQHKNMQFLDGQFAIRETSAREFYVSLQGMIDSTDDREINRMAASEITKAQLWPLIKVVRVYVRAAALSTGAVIVDLPGSQDSNIARAKVADSYMTQCTGLWIVAPINRAVDSQAAKQLLGEAFKRQIQMDDNLGAVTFICSKTDDIKLEEAAESLHIMAEFRKYERKILDLEKQRDEIPGLIDELRSNCSDLELSKRDAEDDLEEWQDLQIRFSQGMTVYTPTKKSPAKRKHSETVTTPPRTPSSNDTPVISTPLTPSDISGKISDLHKQRNNVRRQKIRLESEVRDYQNNIAEINQSIKLLRAEMFRKCISGRNEFAKQRVQADFADGIRDLDEQIAEEEDEENFDPSDYLRDYDSIKANLPVFCVSSLAYQRCMGRLRLEEHVAGFDNMEDTQIPQLQEHCRSLTLKKRRQAALKTLFAIYDILYSLQLWITATSGAVVKLAPKQKEEEMANISKHLESLKMHLDGTVNTLIVEMNRNLNDRIYSKYVSAAQVAYTEALIKVDIWNTKRLRSQGLTIESPVYSTYRAICNHFGVFGNRRGSVDWNARLADPILRTISREWELTFGARTTKLLQEFKHSGKKHINDFHLAMVNGHKQISAFHVLGQQQHIYKDLLQQICDVASRHLNTRQREINRSFAGVIKGRMMAGYIAALGERGKGCFMRMKHRIREHVAAEGHTMFTASVHEAQTQLEEMISTFSSELTRGLDQTWNRTCTDYKAAATASFDERPVSEAQRRLRDELMEIVHGVRLTLASAVADDEGMKMHDSPLFASGLDSDDDPFNTTDRDIMPQNLEVDDIKDELNDMDTV